MSTGSPNHKSYGSMSDLEIQNLFDEVVQARYSHLEANSIICPLEWKEGLGDYAFYGVLDICDQLRKDDPYLFEHTSPKLIAEEIMKIFMSKNHSMIRELFLHEAGILTFSIEGSWIANRINTMLEFDNGINTWAPTLYDGKVGKPLFVFPSKPCLDSEMVRANYIRDVLENVFLFSGAEVGHGCQDDEAMGVTRACFQKIQGKIVSKSHRTSFSEPVDGDVFADLSTLWYGVKRLNADVLVYMTPHRLRGYIERCHNAAAKEGWLPPGWEKLGTLVCCGFRAFGPEQETTANLWNRLYYCEPGLKELCFGAGYGFHEFFECALKFSCLKRHRLSECLFRYEDIVDEKGYTLAYLLKTQALVCSLIKNSPSRNFTIHALTGKERDLGFHILRFTEVIERVCEHFVPHELCGYVNDLSELFMSCFSEVKGGKNMLGLCKATQVVMDKCIQLLGIHPSSCMYAHASDCKPFFRASEKTNYRIIHPSEDAARIERPKSRLEITSMFVNVAHFIFEKGNIYGTVSVLDTCQLANESGWVQFDANDKCYVAYFGREWYNALTFKNGSFIPLGDTSAVHSIPFSSSIKIDLLLKASCVEEDQRDQSYLLCNCSQTINLKKFWDGDSNARCGTLEFNYEEDDGCIILSYILIKDALDTKMQLTFKPHRNVRLSGTITASYGKDVTGELGEQGSLGQYSAQIFNAVPEREYTTREKPYFLTLTLNKTTMAVPAHKYIEMRANLNLVDADENIFGVVHKKKDICVSKSSKGEDIWRFGCETGVFELTTWLVSSQA